jgi:hypothetical protein
LATDRPTSRLDLASQHLDYAHHTDNQDTDQKDSDWNSDYGMPKQLRDSPNTLRTSQNRIKKDPAAEITARFAGPIDTHTSTDIRLPLSNLIGVSVGINRIMQ